ncbi:MAG: hypothetical protein O3B68_19545 [Planctomycetota bacterium]|nr:hypothetical protein [Planctomycetota bacterium]
MRILLIDDEASDDDKFRRGHYMWYYVNALRRAKHEVTVIDNTDEAVEWLRKHAVDCIVLDVLMPPGKLFKNHPDANQGINTGYLLARYLRDFAGIETSIVGLTHLVDDVTAELNRLSNVSCVLSKQECTPGHLLKVLDELDVTTGPRNEF